MKKKNISFIGLVLCVLCYTHALHAQYEYIENKGQWLNNIKYRLNVNDGAIFFENNCLTFNFVDPDGMNYSTAHHGSEGSGRELVKAAHAYRVNFKGANKNPIIYADYATSDYLNYFIGNDQSKWASNVKKYRQVTYAELYPAVDLIYRSDANGIKYDFVVHPGADYRNIDLEYVGTDGLFLENGNLLIKTSVIDLVEKKPYAYQIFNSDTVEIECSYVLKKNRLSFEIPVNYDKTKDLIIDPSLIFSTYTGSTGDNWGFTATWDYDDNVYSGGIVFAVGYPTNVGAYQINFAGGTAPIYGSTYYQDGCDVGIIKYNEDGTQKLFATYLGGSGGQEMPHSLVVNEFNELIIMGTTGSPDFPVTAGAYQTNFAGGDSLVYDNVIGFHQGIDIFVSKLSSNGTQLLGSTYVGGSGNDGLNFKLYYTIPDPVSNINYVEMHGNDSLYFNYGDGARGEVIVDNKNMIYVGTNTFSTDFPAGINPGYQTSSGGGQDGIVFKLNPNLTLMLWSSYLGGSQDDAIFSLSLSNTEEVLVAGGTVSHNFPITVGSYNTSHNGGSTDAFVSKLDMNGDNLIASTYFGSNVYDNAYFVRTDRFDNIFICGQTKASGSTLINNAGYSVPNSGQFIAKFNPNLNELVWSTQFGNGNGRPNISITAFAVDVCDRVYLSGWGREWTYSYYNAQGNYYTWTDQYGTKGMTVTPDAIQSQTDGQDFYVLVLSEDASELEYASFFGEVHYGSCGYSGHDHVDGGTSRFDKKGHIIQSVCASCGGCQEFPTSPDPGVWSTTNNATNCNNAVFKIRIIENLAEANFNPVPAGCAPYTVNFNNTSQGSTFVWDFGDGSPHSSAFNPTHTYTVGGTYTVTLVVGDPLSCNYYDTIQRQFTVIEPGQSNLEPIQICPGQNTVIGPVGTYPVGTTFSWVVGSNLNNNHIQNPVASPNQTTDYMLVATGVCVDSVWQTVIVYEPDIDLFAYSDTTVCPGGTANLFATSSGTVDEWAWASSPSFSSILSNNQNFNASPSASTVYYVRAKENVCNTYLVETVQVLVHAFNYNIVPAQIICVGETTNLTINNLNTGDNLTYSWQPTAQIISGATTNSPIVGPANDQTYYVTITSQIGCTTTNQVHVDVDIIIFSQPDITPNPCFGYCIGSATAIANGIPPYTYVWNTGEENHSIYELCAGSYNVTVTDGNNCTAESVVTLVDPPELMTSFTNVVHPQCDGIGYGSATISPVGGTPSYTYQWNFGGNQQINNQCLTGYNIVSVTDANGCQKIDSVFMISPSDMTSAITGYNMVKCFGDCDGSITVSATLGVPPYSFNWSNGSSGQFVTDLCPGPYTVTVVDAENCVSHQYLYITEPTPLVSNLAISSPIKCFGETGNINLIASGGTIPYSFEWSNGSNQQNQVGVAAGDYFVTVTDANNCQNLAEINISQPTLLVMDTTIHNMLCTGVCNGQIQTYVSGGTPPYTYVWSNETSNPNAFNLCDGDYNLLMLDANNCEITQDFTIVNEDYIPDLAVSSNVSEIFEGEQVSLLAQSSVNGSYSWDNESVLNNSNIANPAATPKETTLFEVLFRDENGCVNTDTIRIKVKEVICGDPYLFVPNAFTPNSDGNNDYFKPYFPFNMVTEVYFAVFDRWGAILYETTDLNALGWDGTYKGEKLATDVFVYWIKARCLNGEEYNHQGNVTLLR
ncbi:MAG TPA: gliding motility-associated C-terminal domain-containing protein [Bacteroidales bacterium]|nr:gliding motility-associated C-terminal domain-containing protein [Bacteroidales bacterium]